MYSKRESLLYYCHRIMYEGFKHIIKHAFANYVLFFHDHLVKTAAARLDISRPTVIKHYRTIRKYISKAIRKLYARKKIASSGVCIADEYKANRTRKHNRGHNKVKDLWVLGIVDAFNTS